MARMLGGWVITGRRSHSVTRLPRRCESFGAIPCSSQAQSHSDMCVRVIIQTHLALGLRAGAALQVGREAHPARACPRGLHHHGGARRARRGPPVPGIPLELCGAGLRPTPCVSGPGARFPLLLGGAPAPLAAARTAAVTWRAHVSAEACASPAPLRSFKESL